MYDVRGQWDIHDVMTFKVIWGQGQGQKLTSVPYQDYFSSVAYMVAYAYYYDADDNQGVE